MKNSVFKPLAIFIIFVFSLSVLIIYLKGIRLPAIGPSKEGEASFSDANISKEGDKILIKFQDIDFFVKSCCSTIVKDVKTKKDDKAISLKGKASFPFSADFEGNAGPSVEEERLVIRISVLTLGKVDMPKQLKSELEKQIQKELDGKINRQYKPKSVRITDKGMEIELR